MHLLPHNSDDSCVDVDKIDYISVQREIVNIHKCYIERQRIATQLKEQLNNLCPILIKGSLETGKKSMGKCVGTGRLMPILQEDSIKVVPKTLLEQPKVV